MIPFFNDAEILRLNTRLVSRRIAAAHGMVDFYRAGDSIIGNANQDKAISPIDKGLLVLNWSAAHPFRRHARSFLTRFKEFFIAADLMHERPQAACCFPDLAYR